ncbi:MAG: hypothetical protein AB1505_12435 [Candidatus Latescibacterota bacterium]
MDLSHAFGLFRHPPRLFAPIPFWFWNDDLEEEELLRQLRAFHQAGYGGVIPHARVGLSRRVGYLTEEFLRLLARVVEECERLGMKVILYDEASYPSGSAQGAVVRENPAYASQALGLWEREVTGPHRSLWRPNTGRCLLDRHVCTVAGRVGQGGVVDPASLRLLDPLPHTLFRLDLPEGHWRAMSVWNVPSGGHIRGAHPEEEDGHAAAPPAADIHNPEAVACFLRLTHDRLYERLGPHFGRTVIALFTDEPSLLGRGPLRPRDPRPYTPGLEDWLETLWGEDPRPWLPALWVDYGPGTAAFRRRWEAAVHQRLHEVFYGLFDWHLVRGNNLINPHAAFYSIRDRRAWESQPDLGVHNAFWPYLPALLEYACRLSWLQADGEQVCRVGVLGDDNALPWEAAAHLLTHQMDFLYLDEEAVTEAQVAPGVLRVGRQEYRAVVVDGLDVLSPGAARQLDLFARSGGTVLHWAPGLDLAGTLAERVGRDLRLDPPHPDLRYLHYRRDGLDFYLVTHEGEEALAGRLTLDLCGAVQTWDPLCGEPRPVRVGMDAGKVWLEADLERRDSLVIAVDSRLPFAPQPGPPALRREDVPAPREWEVRDAAGRAVPVPAPGDWAREPGWETFTGTLTYAAAVDLPACAEAWLDLGAVGDLARVSLDGRPVGQRLWRPYRLRLGEHLPAGRHRLEIDVTNTMANAYEGLQAPSGLMGPVRLEACWLP